MILFFILSYLFVGAYWAWGWYFKDVRIGAGFAEYSFYLLLILVWPVPVWTEVIANFRGR